MKTTSVNSTIGESRTPGPQTARMNRKARTRRLLIIIGTVIIAVFLVYLLLILIYPSMNIGMNP